MPSRLYLVRSDIRRVPYRGAGTIALKYAGRRLRFHDRMYGYDPGVFFAVDVADVPLPEQLVTLASTLGVALDETSFVADLRRAVADLLLVEATMEAPEYLAMVSDPKVEWLSSDLKGLEHQILVAENRVRDLTKAVEAQLRHRAMRPPTVSSVQPRTYAAMPPASPWMSSTPAPTPVVAVPVPAPSPAPPEPEPQDGPVETSEATGRKVLAAVKVAREQELPQRLPGGVRRALLRQPAGLYLSVGEVLERKPGICAAMVAGAESGKRSGESVLIDWDGEWPVVARRYGSHGRIVYRVEDALRRQGLTTGEAA